MTMNQSMFKSLKIAFWNARSLRDTKIYEVTSIMKDENISLLGVAETFKIFNSELEHIDFRRNGKVFTGLNHRNGRRGLVSMRDKNFPIQFLPREFITQEEFQLICGLLQNVLLVYVYVPNGSLSQPTKLLITTLERLISKY